MFLKLVILVAIIYAAQICYADVEFTFNGFSSSNLTLDGIADITSNGLLRLTNETMNRKGRAFYPIPINFKNSPNSSVFSFSTTFVCALVPQIPSLFTHGLTFAITPPGGLPGALPYPYFGLFNDTTDGNSSNHVVAVELDTLQNREFNDIDNNHVGIDINGLASAAAKSAGYYQGNQVHNFSLGSGKPIQVWVEYDGRAKKMDVTVAPLSFGNKPSKPLLSFGIDISQDILETVSIGFTSATGTSVSTQYVLGWSFKMNGIAQQLDPSKLPKLPRVGPKTKSRYLVIGVPVISIFSLLIIVSGVGYYVLRKRKFAELLEDWELDYGPHRFNYKELYIATNGFSEKQILGAGGFGSVYRGVLPKSQNEIAVKKVDTGTVSIVSTSSGRRLRKKEI